MNNFLDLRQLFTLLWRRWWLLLLCAVVAGAAGYGFSQLQSRVYEAQATIIVGRSISAANPDRLDLQVGQQLALTYAELVRRQPILQGTIDSLGLDENWQQLRTRVTVWPVDNTQLLEIVAEAETPEEAQKIADEVTKQLIRISPADTQPGRTSEAQQFVQQRLVELQLNIENGQARLDQLNSDLATSIQNSIERSAQLQNEITTLETLLTTWNDSYARLLSAATLEPGVNHLSVVEPAEANPEPTQPRILFNTLLAAMIGLVGGLGVIFLQVAIDDTIKTPEEIGQRLGLSMLGGIGQIKGRKLQKRLLSRQNLLSPVAEEYRLLRSRLQFLWSGWSHKVVMVASPTVSEQSSIVVANLAIVLAQSDLSVVIVDTNLRRPMQHQIFGLSNTRGVSDLLIGPDKAVEAYLQRTADPNLHILAAGQMLEYPSESLGSARMKQILDDLAEYADIVLCDSAQTATLADALSLSGQVNGVIVVLESGKTRSQSAEIAVQNLRQAGALLLGAILSPMPTLPPTLSKSIALMAPITPRKNGALPEDTRMAQIVSQHLN